MIKRIITPNILEVAFLLDRRHQIADVATAISWPYGIIDLAVTVEGNNIDMDRALYLRQSTELHNLERVPAALEAIRQVMWQQSEGVIV